MKIISKTDIGLKRATNQDFSAAGTFPDGTGWIVVCDGMGGANGGNIASEIAVEKIKEYLKSFYEEALSQNGLEKLLTNAVESANGIIFGVSSSDEALSGMGTTVVAVLIKENNAYIVHVGDSRAYVITKDGAEQITVDHSMVQELVMLGSLSPEEARVHPQKNIITRALGIKPQVDTEFDSVSLEEGDRLLVCTDGLSNYAEDSEIFELSKENTVEKFADELVEKALHSGGNDNITVVVAEV